MESMPTYKKIEVAIFGVLLPAILAIYTITLLTQGEAVFWGRSSTVLYHGNEAYLISLLWFGVAGFMLGQFFLRPLRLVGAPFCKATIYLSLALVVVGLASSVVLV
jgi:hypothetical protein